MKRVSFLLFAIACLFVAHSCFAEDEAKAAFLKRIENAYLKSELDTVIEMTCWDGVAAEEKTKAIKRYKQEIALKATKVELLGKDAADWEDWEENNILHTYNATVLHTLVVHLEPGSKIQLNLGEVSVKDLRIPVGLANGKLCLLRGIEKPAAKQK